jgi:anti-sigma factor ChrR (cupin superfamily)
MSKEDPNGAVVLKMMKAIAGSTGKTSARAAADPVFIKVLNEVVHRSGDAAWREIREGITTRPIWDSRTKLIRCAAGSSFPGHPHAAEELMVVLDGRIRMGETCLSTGDIEVSPAGSMHPEGEAIEDCLLLIQVAR